MSSLLRRLSERAQTAGTGRLRSLAAQSFAPAAATAQPPFEEADLQEVIPARPASHDSKVLMAETRPLPDKSAEGERRGSEAGTAAAGMAGQHPSRPPLRREPEFASPPPPRSDLRPAEAAADLNARPLMPVAPRTASEPPEGKEKPRRRTPGAPDRDDDNPGRHSRRAQREAGGDFSAPVRKVESPEVHIHIGRIEVRSAPTPPAAPRAPGPRAAAPSLDDYLSRRGGGR